jgi:hypothetical protein
MNLASLWAAPPLPFAPLRILPYVKSVPRMSIGKRVTMWGKVVVKS